MSGNMTINIVTKLRNLGDKADSSQSFVVSGVVSEIRKKDILDITGAVTIALADIGSCYGIYIRNISATSTANELFVSLSTATPTTSTVADLRIPEGGVNFVTPAVAQANVYLKNFSIKGKIAFEIIAFGS